jgi:hypothetical protein
MTKAELTLPLGWLNSTRLGYFGKSPKPAAQATWHGE